MFRALRVWTGRLRRGLWVWVSLTAFRKLGSLPNTPRKLKAKPVDEDEFARQRKA